MVEEGPVSMNKMKGLQNSLRSGIKKIKDDGKHERLNDAFKSDGD